MHNPIQNSTVQQLPSVQQSSYAPGSLISPVKQPSPSSPTNLSPFALRRSQQLSEAQSIYSSAVPLSMQSPPGNSQYSVFSNSNSEVEFDASILYLSPVSTSSHSMNSPPATSPNLHPQRYHGTSLDSSHSVPPISSSASQDPQSQPVQTSYSRSKSHNVLRRKAKTASSLALIDPIVIQPTTSSQKPREIPVYSLVAQAPLDPSSKPTTPAFQTSSIQLDQPSRPSISASMTIPQQQSLPLRAQTSPGYLTGTMSTDTLSLSNGMVSPPLNSVPSLMSAHPEPGSFSNGIPAPSMPASFNTQPQSLMSQTQLHGMAPPMTVSPTLMPLQQNNNIPNGMLPPNTMAQTMAQPPSMLPNGMLMPQTMPSPQPPNMLPNGYAPGLPYGTATPMQGFVTQTPVQSMAVQQMNPAKEDKNNQLMKKIGLTLGKAVVKIGTKYALEQMGVDDSALIFLEVLI